MSVFYRLERGTAINILFEWLSVSDFGKLDSSFTTKESRELFHSLAVASNRQTSYQDALMVGNKSMALWLLNKKFRKISLTYEVLNSVFDEYFHYFDHISSLTIQSTWQPTDDDEIKFNIIGRVFSDVRNLTEISFTAFKNLTFQHNIQSYNNCLLLHSINFCGCLMLKDKLLVELAQTCSCIQHITLSHCRSISDVGLNALLLKFGPTTLKTLHFAHCIQLFAVKIQSIGKVCTKLTSFNANGMGLLSLNCPDLIPNVIRNNPNLMELFLRDTHSVDNNLVDLIAQYLPHLKVFDCAEQFNNKMTYYGFITLASNCHELTDIFWDCANYVAPNILTVDTFVTMATHLPHLKSFKFPTSDLTKEIFTVVTFEIVSLDFGAYGACEITSLRIFNKNTFNLLPKPKSMSPQFRVLEPYCGSVTSFVCGSKQKPEAVINFLQAMPNLTSINLSNLDDCDLTDAHMIALSNQHMKLMEFTFTKSSKNFKFGNVGLTALFKTNSNLTSLISPHCMEITDTTLINIAIYCKNMKYIDMSCCPHITDAGLNALSENCRKLEHIKIIGSYGVSEAAASLVMQKCKFLEVFKFRCQRSTKEFQTMTVTRYQNNKL